MNAFVNDLREESEEVLEDICAAEMQTDGADSISILLASETGLQDMEILGLCGGVLHIVHAAVCARRGRGRGPALLINDVALDRHWGFRSRAFEQEFRILAVHECSHLYGVDRTTFLPDNPPISAGAIALYQSEESAICNGPYDAADIFKWHDDRFNRTCLHLVHRIQANWGVALPAGRMFAGSQYGLSSSSFYRDALGDEPERLAELPLREALWIPPPPAFIELWESDVRKYFQSTTKHAAPM